MWRGKMAEQVFEMKMNLNVLNHLGINLYSNIPAVLSEIVANAWDADATEVKVYTDNDKLIISDNGCGMDISDINEKFLTVGYQKREAGYSTTEKYNRKVMGRKGIGKLSLFSIANSVEIHTKKENFKQNSLKIDVSILEKKIKSGESNYFPEEILNPEVKLTGTGTTIILSRLKKRVNINTDAFLRKRLARRFSVLGKRHDFQMFVNDQEILLSDREYFNKLKMIWSFGDLDLPPNIVKNIDHRFTLDNQLIGTGEFEGSIYTVTGWIGAVDYSGDMNDGEENLNRISLLIRGKVAEEDVLPSFSEGGLYTKYLIGEIGVDFLDEDDRADITTSGRQSIKEDDELYKQFRVFLKSQLKQISREWKNSRDKEGTSEALEDVAIRKWFDSLGTDKRKKAKKLFGKINRLTLEKNERQELFKQSVIAFELLRYKDNLDAFDKLTPETIYQFSKIFNNLSDIEATLYYQIVAERLRIIETLDNNKDSGVLEKVMQEHVFENLWLLDPSWDRATEDPRMEVVMKKELDNPKLLTKEEQNARLDIQFRKASGSNVIIELKKADINIRPMTLLDQVDKYSGAVEKVLKANGESSKDYEIICLIGKLPSVWSNPEKRAQHVEMFKKLNARVITYDQLITTALKQYSSYFESHKETNRLNEIIQDINIDKEYFA